MSILLAVVITLLSFATTGGSDKHAVLKTQAVHAQMGVMYKKAAHTMMGNPTHEEYSFTVNADGSVTPITTSGTANSNSVTVPAGTQAIIHTHPAGTKPTPSEGDVLAAQKANCPNYALSQHELWVANPDGTTAKVGDIDFKKGDLVIKWKS